METILRACPNRLTQSRIFPVPLAVSEPTTPEAPRGRVGAVPFPQVVASQNLRSMLAAALIVAAVQFGPWVWAHVIEPLIAVLTV